MLEVKYAPRLNELSVEGTMKLIEFKFRLLLIVVFASFTELYVNYGSEIELNCTGDAFPSVIANWSTPLSNGLRISGSPLKIPSFKWMNQGQYECILDNGVEFAAHRKITLFAAEKSPNLLKPSVTEVTVFEGDDIVMDCMCERCEYPANLWWFHENNSNPLNSMNVTANLTHDQQLKRIEMKIISMNESGIYKCQLECTHQKCIDEFTVKVVVRDPRTIANMPQNKQFYQCKSDMNVDWIEFTHLDDTIPSNMYSCRSSLDDQIANFSVVLLGKRLRFLGKSIELKMSSVISESDSRERKEFMSECTLNALQPPELTHIIHKKAAHLDFKHSTKFPMNDVFECISSTNIHSKRNENRLFAIFRKLIQFGFSIVYQLI